MRHLRTVLACLAVSVAFAAPAGASSAILVTKAAYAGPRPVSFGLRDGERYLAIATSAYSGTVALDVTTATGTVRVCASSKVNGPLSIDGLGFVTVVPVMDDVTCGVPAVTGTILAYFSHTSFTLADAYAKAQPDPGRDVVGGI